MMTKKQAIAYFGSVSATARAVGISRAAVFNWPDVLTDRISDRVVAALARKGLAVANFADVAPTPAQLPITVSSKNLSGSDFRVLVALVAHKGESGEAWPSVSRLVEMTGMAQSNVSRALTSLEKSGMITREKVGTRNRYTFPCLDNAEQQIEGEAQACCA